MILVQLANLVDFFSLIDVDIVDGYFRDTLMSIAKHYETGECLPEDIYKKLLAARTFRAGSLSLRQVSIQLYDVLFRLVCISVDVIL